MPCLVEVSVQREGHGAHADCAHAHRRVGDVHRLNENRGAATPGFGIGYDLSDIVGRSR